MSPEGFLLLANPVIDNIEAAIRNMSDMANFLVAFIWMKLNVGIPDLCAQMHYSADFWRYKIRSSVKLVFINLFCFAILKESIMKNILFIFAAIILILAQAPVASAHLPYLERDSVKIVANDPEISKAYYGWLGGAPAVYSISSRKPFSLYLNLLSPQTDNGRQDYSADIYDKNGELLDKLDGADYIWLVSYEPFANDYYTKGPEFEKLMPAGDYRVKVYNSGNSGNYVLAIGKKEDLSPGQFARTLAVLPSVKQEFFGRPWWEAFNNLVGLAALVLLVVLLIVIYFIISFFKSRKLKKRLDVEYAQYEDNGKFGGAARG